MPICVRPKDLADGPLSELRARILRLTSAASFPPEIYSGKPKLTDGGAGMRMYTYQFHLGIQVDLTDKQCIINRVIFRGVLTFFGRVRFLTLIKFSLSI